MPSVSVLVVGYHAYDELDRCLASVERFEPDAEIIVVDHDADDVRGRALAEAHPRIRYVPRRENPGFGAGVNQAAAMSNADLLLVLNPDVELRGPVVSRLAAVLDAHPATGIVGGLIREADGSIQPSARRFPDLTTGLGGRTSWLTKVMPGNPLTRRNLSTGGVSGEPIVVDWVTGAFMLVRADLFRTLRGFDERFFMYWEDSDLCMRALQAGWKTMYEPRAEVMHLTGRSSRHAPVRTTVAFHVSALRHYWKHGSPVARVLVPVAAAGLAARLAVRLLSARRASAAPAPHAESSRER